VNGIKGKLWAQVAEMERRAISQALDDSQWNKSQAARDLGISYPSLLQKIKLFGLDRRVRVKSLNTAI
jgi:DNA-binding NtrC family response regulator